MTPREYSEARLVENSALDLLTSLEWEAASAIDEVFGAGGTLGRETSAEVVLVPRLRTALERLNLGVPAEAVSIAIDALTRDRSAMSLVAANRELYDLLKDGVEVSIPDRKHGGQRIERLRVIDWNDSLANDFLVVSQMTITGPLYTIRPDLIGFVNGLPLVVIEFKKPGVAARRALDENFNSYKHPQNGVPALFWSNAFLIASNGSESRVGSVTADWDRFFEWSRIEREDEPRRVSLEVILLGTCEPLRLLDLVENFTLFSEHKAGVVKILAQNHQVLGVNNAISAALTARGQGHGRGGVFWQTQGSGKSFSMVFFAQKILRKIPGNWTFVIVTDRIELDDQIAKTFKACGAVSEAESRQCHAQNSAELRALLGGNHRYVFTLIHKFLTTEVLCDRRDVMVLTDEAHRSQYDTLALNMRAAMPNALFLAFTGTPLIAGEERTREVFGDYVSIYDFQQSVEDGATVPLFYENRTPALSLENPALNDEIYEVVENAGLDERQEERLERELGRQYHLITRDERLETIARDIVQHFLGRGFMGKAMVVSIDKATALRMYEKVRTYWEAERSRVSAAVRAAPPGSEEFDALMKRRKVLTSTEMALIVSPAQNEIELMRAQGLDIAPHRKRMNDEELDERFKDSDDPLSIVFLCAMWLTGFDAPSVSTVYLDKPMRNHTLMQTIARANRVFPGKHSGMIVDYANVFASLERALAIYGAGTGGRTPVREKRVLLDELRRSIGDAVSYCASRGVDLAAIEAAGSNMRRLERVVDAVNALISPDPIRKDFLAHVRLVMALYDAAKPDPAILEFRPRVDCLTTIASSIRVQLGEPPPDISQAMAEIKALLDRSIASDGFEIRGASGHAEIDLSRIDFEALAKRFATSKRKSVDLERLKAAVRAQLERMVQVNRTRADYLTKFEELIEAYNNGSRNIDELFRELLALSRALTDEEQRHVRENLTEEELTVFDLLIRPGPDLSVEERDEVKKVARQLLQRLQGVLSLDWRNRQSTRARVEDTIGQMLDDGLPRAYSPELYREKCGVLFQHVFETYGGELPVA
jgi:type I restriction enzyme R subunit